jgi:hypothetical protein
VVVLFLCNSTVLLIVLISASAVVPILGLSYDYGLTGPALMLQVVIVTTVVMILRFTITPTTAVVCFRWVLFCGSIVLM